MNPRKPKPVSTSTTAIAAEVAAEDKGQAAMDVNAVSLEDDADTIRLVALQHHDALALVDTGIKNVAPRFDPYNNSGLTPADHKPRKSIDDLRKLSAAITKEKSYTRKGK